MKTGGLSRLKFGGGGCAKVRSESKGLKYVKV